MKNEESNIAKVTYPLPFGEIREGLYLFLLIVACGMLGACSMEPADWQETSGPTQKADRLIVLCEGLWGMDNSTLSLLDNGMVTNRWFRQQNPGRKLGDTGNDMLQVNDTLIAISVNWSNIIQYIRPDGTAISATENIPNNRRLATDGKGFLYCTSYANHGYVAKIDLRTKQIVDTCHVGYEPEGIAYYDGRLFVCNSGGYSFQEGHDYESTVSVVDAQTMRELKRIDTHCPNLYGAVAQNGQFLCINAAGNYYDVQPRCVVLNMASEEFRVFDFPATYCCAYGNKFYIIGSAFSYSDGSAGGYAISAHTITLPSLEASDGLAEYGFATETIERMDTPYGIYISEKSGHMYITDARGNATNGYLYEFAPASDSSDATTTRYALQGLNPSRMIAVGMEN